jgi:hypothetical protein
MGEGESQDRDEILRFGQEDWPLSREAAATLDSVMFTPAVERINQAGERRQLRAEVIEPLEQAIGANPAAADAARRLNERVRDDRGGVGEAPFRGGDVSPLAFDLSGGVKLFSPPFDYARNAPLYGQGVAVSSEPGAGTVRVEIGDDSEYGGGMVASGAVGLGFGVSRSGHVSVRPYFKHAYEWILSCLLLSASVQGRVGFYAEEENGLVVSNFQEARLFDQTSETYAYEVKEEETLSFNGDAHFSAQAGRRYRVWFWATLAGDQSGSGTFSASYARHFLSIKVPFLGVELV